MLHRRIAGINQNATTLTRLAQEAALGWVATGGLLARPAPSSSMGGPILVCLLAYFDAELQGDLRWDLTLN
jgi:hypothetical protein